jgi:hypothetical protein
LCYLFNKALKWESLYTGLRAFPDLSKCCCSRPVSVGFLRAFLFSLFLLSVELLARTSPAASRRLIRTASSSSSIIVVRRRREHHTFAMAWVQCLRCRTYNNCICRLRSATLRDLGLLPYHARVPLLLRRPRKGRAFAMLVLALEKLPPLLP